MCGENDLECLSKNLSDSDRHGLEAIHLLHRQLDDDANGNVDLSESDDVSHSFLARSNPIPSAVVSRSTLVNATFDTPYF